MTYTAEQNENMKDGMDISAFFAECIEHRADGIRNASAEKPRNSTETDDFVKRSESKDYDPAHRDICYIGNYLEFVYIYRIENYAEDRGAPDDAEKSPADRPVERNEGVRSIRPRNQKIYSTVVENSEDPFGVVYLKGVIHGRHHI